MVKNQIFSPVTTNTVVGSYKTKEIVINDKDQPLTFKQWLYRSRGIKHGFEYEEYDNYVKRWNAVQTQKTSTTEKIREDYKAFIRSLVVFLTDEEKKMFNEDFSLDDYMNLEQIIPHCASKLRDIMIYYQHKREAIKMAKLKYNLVGTSTAIERMLHDYLLRAFTKNGKFIKINNPEFYEKLPNLKPLNTHLEIKIQELYDDTEYLDKVPEKSAKEYFGEISDEAAGFYDEHGYSKDEIDHLLSNGYINSVYDPTAITADDNTEQILDEEQRLVQIITKIRELIGADDEETNDLPASAYIDFDKTNTIDYYQRELTKKYLGEDQYIITGGYYVNKYIDLSFDINAGNNWISWPSGEGDFERLDKNLSDLALSATTLLTNEDVVGSSSYIDADKVFLQYGDTVEGAWLKDTSSAYTTTAMRCKIYANKPFSFRFPYCDYGVSGEGIEWSGPGISNEAQIFYTFPEEDRKAIMAEYWQKAGEYDCVPIAINRTSLIDCGAKAGTYYQEADRITLREGTSVHDSNPNGVYNGVVQEAFLYKVASSDVPVKPGKNYIFWPYQNITIDGAVELPRGGCVETCLSADEWRKIFGSRAGYGLFDSDIIYKLDSPNGSPIECAFLSGVPITDLSAARSYSVSTSDYDHWLSTTWTDSATGCFQTGRYGKCSPNGYFTFIWLDEDTPIDDVVFHIDHQPDCKYLHSKKYSLFENHPENTDTENSEITFKEWQDCDCGAIINSPFGHPGEKYEDYNGYADCIFVDNTYPLPFDKDIWFGDDVDNYRNSKTCLDSHDFAWYKLTGDNRVEPDVGWGPGKWVCGTNGTNNEQFILRKGIQYKYYRTGLGHTQNDLIDGTMAPIYITHKNSEKTLKFARPTWMKAVLDPEGNWVSTTSASDMVIRADDTIVYDHMDTEWWCITGNEKVTEWDEEVDAEPENDGKAKNFVTYNYVPVSSYIVTAMWPRIAPLDQFNLPTRSDIDIVKWEIDGTAVNLGTSVVTKICSVDEPVYFSSMVTGNIYISAYGYTNRAGDDIQGYSFEETYKPVENASAEFVITFVPPTTAHYTSATYETYTVTANTIGFPVNIPLKGWDYRRSAPSGESTSADGDDAQEGARPIWCVGKNDSSAETRYKGIDKWGGGVRFVNGYIPIMQPQISDMTISGYAPITYMTTRPFMWVQDIEMNIPSRDRRWCKLEIDKDKVHVLAQNGKLAKTDFTSLVSRATDESSSMYFTAKIDGDPVTINYYANQPFLWEETIQDITDGIAPTGGNYIDKKQIKAIEAYYPWANLSSRHSPSFAVAPFYDNFYRKEDKGGYVIPQQLGASVAVAKSMLTKTDDTNRTSADNTDLITDTDLYSRDSGLTDTIKNYGVILESTDSGWMKSGMLNGVNAGFIRTSDKNQQFMSYQTANEKRGRNDIGLMRMGDITDPWEGDLDTTWMTKVYDRHFTKQEPIAEIRKTYVRTDEIKDWTSDIFGYSYGIWKKPENETTEYNSVINKRRYSKGALYIRRNDGTIKPIHEFIKCLNIDENDPDEFYSVDVMSDVLIIVGEKRIIFYKLCYDDSITNGYKIRDEFSNVRQIDLVSDEEAPLNLFKLFTGKTIVGRVRVAGIWKFPAEDKVSTVYLVPWTIPGSGIRYSYVIDVMEINNFVSDAKIYGQITEEKDQTSFTIEELYSEIGETGISSFGDYQMIGPVMDYLNKTYTMVFQMRKTAEDVGWFVKTKIDLVNNIAIHKMVKKAVFRREPIDENA